MAEFFKIARDMVKSPLFYAYWAVSVVGIAMSHINEGARGSWKYGVISISSTIVGIVFFYWHMKKLRVKQDLPGDRSGLGLFLSVFAFRIRLLLVFTPAIALFFWLGTFDELTKAYFGMTLASEEDRFGPMKELLATAWPWLLLGFIYMTLELAGRSHVIALGYSDHALKRCLKALWRLRVPMALLMGIELILIALDSTGSYFETRDVLSPLVNPIIRSLLTPIEYLLSLGGTMYMALRLWKESPDFFPSAPKAE